MRDKLGELEGDGVRDAQRDAVGQREDVRVTDGVAECEGEREELRVALEEREGAGVADAQREELLQGDVVDEPLGEREGNGDAEGEYDSPAEMTVGVGEYDSTSVTTVAEGECVGEYDAPSVITVAEGDTDTDRVGEPHADTDGGSSETEGDERGAHAEHAHGCRVRPWRALPGSPSGPRRRNTHPRCVTRKRCRHHANC